MAFRTFRTEKLIRDKLPDILQAKGITLHNRTMTNEEFILSLKNKLIEEAEEVNQARNLDELTEELADVLEIFQTLSQVTGISLQEIERKCKEKKDRKGGFEKKVYNHKVEIEENHPEIVYYLNKPQQYPEIKDPLYDFNCLFCAMARGKRAVNFFAKFRHCYVIKDQFPVSEGHALIIPYEHTLNWFTASEEIRLDIVNALHFVKEQLDVAYRPHGYNIGANCGEAAGQTIMHLHVHLIPRYEGDMEDPKGGVRGVIPSKQKY